MTLHRVLVTGANKGIGLAIVKGLLERESHCFVFLGCRDMTRGLDAVKSLTDECASYSGRVEALQIDVSDAGSVNQAAVSVRTRFSDTTQTPLTAVVNNAGIMCPEYSLENFAKCINVNVHGVMRTTEAFLPLLDQEKGRIVMISSAAGPSFVAGISEERKKQMTDPAVTLPQVKEECAHDRKLSKHPQLPSRLRDGTANLPLQRNRGLPSGQTVSAGLV